jgi:hypothetical protein
MSHPKGPHIDPRPDQRRAYLPDDRVLEDSADANPAFAVREDATEYRALLVTPGNEVVMKLRMNW